MEMVSVSTIRDVAKEAKVSIATVSNVLNGRPNVSDDTIVRVRRAIQKLGYVPSYVSRSAKLVKSQTIGVIVEDITIPFYQSSTIIKGISIFCEKESLSLELINMNLGSIDNLNAVLNNISSDPRFIKEFNNALKTFEMSNLCGIIYVGHHPRDISDIVSQIPYPTVVAYSTASDVDYVIEDDEQGGELATQYLINHGHRKIGIISGRTDSHSAYFRQIGFQRKLMENGIAFDPRKVYAGKWVFEDGVDAINYLMELEDKPTAIFAMSDIMGYGAMSRLMELGYKIPDDISIIGFDNMESSSYVYPHMTSVSLPFEKMGYEAASLLMRRINNDIQADHPIHKKIICEVYERDTVKDLSK